MKCPDCNQEVKVYGLDIEKHKVYVYKNGKKTSKYSICPRKKV